MNNHVYFIEQENSNLIKIGVAKNIKKRFSSLQTSNPQKLILRGYIFGGYNTEKELHDYFCKFRISGEWFSLSEEILLFIKENCLTDLNAEINRRYNRSSQIKLTSYDGGEFNIVYRAKIEVIENMKLNSNEKLIYLSLRDYVQYPTNCVMINGKIPSIDELVPITSLSSRAIKTSIKSLEEKCLIKRIQYGHKKAIYINPEYYASGKDLDIETLKMFGLLVCDDNKIDEYIDNNL